MNIVNKIFSITDYENSRIFEIKLQRENIENIEIFNMFFENYEKYIKNGNKLIIFNINANFINDDLLEEIINEKLLSYKNNIYTIKIPYNRITQKGLFILFNFLSLCPNLYNLECEYNLFDTNIFYKLLIESNLPNELKNKFTYHDW